MELRDVGDGDTLVGVFRNAAKQLANPDTITLTITAPDGTVTTRTGAVGAPGDFRNPSVGRWEYDHDWTTRGDWSWSYRGAGAVTSRARGAVRVRP